MKWSLVMAALLLCSANGHGAQVRWQSAVIGAEIAGEVIIPPTKPADSMPTVVYLKNLSIPRLGRESDDAIIADLVKQGHLVLVLDYARHARAVSPELNVDLLKLRRDIVDARHRSLLMDYKVDVNRLFIVPEGFRLRRDVQFARDGERVLGMDVIYPADPEKPVPVLMEITCDNENRMGSASLLYCHDTLMEGAALAGFAGAMIDHPVPPPYKGLDDPMSQCIERLEAATKALRSLGDQCGLNGKIGVMGFSRGATMAAILAARGRQEVQAALVHGNRFDYLDLRADDPMLARFEKAWGSRAANAQRWAEHGAVYYLSPDAAPMFLTTSDTESAEYRDGLEKLANRLKSLGIEHEYQVDCDGRGHRLSMDAKTLSAIYGFMRKHLAQVKGVR